MKAFQKLYQFVSGLRIHIPGSTFSLFLIINDNFHTNEI
jgi:hypothetical protein